MFTTWCGGRRTAPFLASPKTLVAFIDEMTASRTPATVRRYVSSITTVQKGARRDEPARAAALRPFRIEDHNPAIMSNTGKAVQGRHP